MISKIVLASVVAFSASAAHADIVHLADIYTNDCTALQSEVRLLNSDDAHVTTTCEFGGFWNNGNHYHNRLETHISVPYAVYPGTAIRLGHIDTNNCSRARDMIELLNSRDVSIDTDCEIGNFVGNNGHIYRYRLNTTVRVN